MKNFLTQSVSARHKGESGWRDPCSLVMAIVVLLLNFWDATFTYYAFRYFHTDFDELNPLWGWVMDAYGLTPFVFVKVASTVIFMSLVLRTRRNFSRGALLFLFGYYMNLGLVQFGHLKILHGG